MSHYNEHLISDFITCKHCGMTDKRDNLDANGVCKNKERCDKERKRNEEHVINMQTNIFGTLNHAIMRC